MIEPDLEPEPTVDPAHPLGVAARQVIVDRDEVDALAAETVEVDRQGRDQRLALARLHLGDPTEVERRPTHHLHVVVALADHPVGGLTGDGKCLDQDVVERCAVVEPLAELAGLGLQLAVGHLSKLVFEGIDVGNHSLQCLEFLAFSRAEDAIEDAHAAAQPTGADGAVADSRRRRSGRSGCPGTLHHGAGPGRTPPSHGLVSRGVASCRIEPRIGDQRRRRGDRCSLDRAGIGTTQCRLGGSQRGARGDDVVDHEHAPARRRRAGPEHGTVQPSRAVETRLGTPSLALEQPSARDAELGGDTTGDQLGLIEPTSVATLPGRRCPGDDVEIVRAGHPRPAGGSRAARRNDAPTDAGCRT